MQFRFEQWIELPRAALFAFHENPANLAVLQRDWAAFRIIRHDGSVAPGSRTWVETTVAAIVPVVLGFEHTVYEPPRRFGEEMIHGPFKRFSHVHEFAEDGAGTRLTDLLEIELPWYYGGELGMRIFVAPLLRRTFRQRGITLLALARAGTIGQQGQPPSG